jgi:hypothetical protein
MARQATRWKNTTTRCNARPGTRRPLPAETVVRVVEALTAIRMGSRRGPHMVLDCPLCVGPRGRGTLILSARSMTCIARGHSVEVLARLLLVAALGRSWIGDADDAAVPFLLGMLSQQEGDT